MGYGHVTASSTYGQYFMIKTRTTYGTGVHNVMIFTVIRVVARDGRQKYIEGKKSIIFVWGPCGLYVVISYRDATIHLPHQQ
jgi:hypothetical protein